MFVKTEKHWKAEIFPSGLISGKRFLESREVPEYTLKVTEEWPLLGLPAGKMSRNIEHFQGYGRFQQPMFTPALVVTENHFIPWPNAEYHPDIQTHNDYGPTMINWIITIDLSYPNMAKEWSVPIPHTFFKMSISHPWGTAVVRNMNDEDFAGLEDRSEDFLLVESDINTFLDNSSGEWKLIRPQQTVSRQFLCPRWRVFASSYHAASMVFFHGSSENKAHYMRKNSRHPWMKLLKPD